MRNKSSLCVMLLSASTLIWPQVAQSGETVTYAYDARGRLVSVSRSGSVNNGVQAAYTYDKADNRTNVTVCAAGITLLAGQSMASPDGRFVLSMQTDGNLVLYGPDGPTWWTGTNGGSDRRMVMQPDGNLVVYNGANQALWASNTSGNPGSTLSLQNDGNLVIVSCAGAPIWTSNTVYQQPSFAINDASATEGGTLVFTVTRSGASGAARNVNFATANGTAAAGSDYAAVSGTLPFAAGETSKQVSVATIDDAVSESSEQFSVILSDATGTATISDATGVGTIHDNDAPPGPCAGISFAVNDPTVYEGSPLVFTVSRAGSTASSCSVNYATANGTATSPTHYAATSGTLTFTATQTSRTVSVTTVYKGRLNGTLRMYLNLSSPNNGAAIADNQGIGSIVADGGGGCKLCSQATDPAAAPPPSTPDG
jgi:hypothetical protein